jgi:hypothetical protein
MEHIPAEVLTYYQGDKPLVCELNVQPWSCEFWPVEELETYNSEYELPKYAPGFFGFATSGGGEMFAISPAGQVVCLPLIGMEPNVARTIADSWFNFEGMLRSVL